MSVKRRLVLGGLCVLAACHVVVRVANPYEGWLAVVTGVWPFNDATKYADGYTDAGFAAVTPGMTMEEVRRLLGEPLHVSGRKLEETVWRYSASTRPTHFRGRLVIFYRENVVEKAAELFIY